MGPKLKVSFLKYLLNTGLATHSLFLLLNPLTPSGFYEDSLEWVTVEGIQVVATMSSGNTLGKYDLSTRLTSIMHVAYMAYSGREALHSVYSAYLYPLLQVHVPSHPVWSSPKSVQVIS